MVPCASRIPNSLAESRIEAPLRGAWRRAYDNRGAQPRVVEGPHAVDLRRRIHGGPCRAEQCQSGLPLPGLGPAPSGGLTTNSRRTGYRSPNGGIRVLAATTTLAAGINTPASTVILAENEFLGQDSRPFTIAEYKNMAGRAGRLGYSEIGKAIILADTPVERAQLRGGETHAHKSHFGPRLPGANRLAGC